MHITWLVENQQEEKVEGKRKETKRKKLKKKKKISRD
jgi:hypothetical protein